MTVARASGGDSEDVGYRTLTAVKRRKPRRLEDVPQHVQRTEHAEDPVLPGGI